MASRILDYISNRCLHFFHIVSNVRPIFWIGLYVIVTPIFAFIYWALPEGQFRIPDENPMDYGSCLYYSIVTITTLGFGDYTPTHAWSQAVTACEVMCGLIVLGLFLNAVGSMKSEIDVTSALEKQRLLHFETEKSKLLKTIPVIIHHINIFLTNCYIATTPADKVSASDHVFNRDFTIDNIVDLSQPSPLSTDGAPQTILQQLSLSATRTSLFLDSVQNRIDITLWPNLLEDFFAFVANEEIFTNSAVSPDKDEVFRFIKKNSALALSIESALSETATSVETA